MKKLYLILLILTVLVQLFVPFKMILSRETILREGTRFSFKTRPIDPADPFQGRFVRLELKDTVCNVEEDDYYVYKGKQKIYVTVEIDDEGFAQFENGSKDVPDTPHYLKTRTRWLSFPKDSEFCEVGLQIPFDRFYMEEEKEPRAEKVAIDASRKGDCWVDVRILNGKAVIEDVYVEGESIRELSRVLQQ